MVILSTIIHLNCVYYQTVVCSSQLYKSKDSYIEHLESESKVTIVHCVDLAGSTITMTVDEQCCVVVCIYMYWN